METFYEIWQKNRGKIIGALLGIIFAVIILLFGFFKALFVILCAIIGYYIGKIADNKESIREFLDRILPPGIR